MTLSIPLETDNIDQDFFFIWLAQLQFVCRWPYFDSIKTAKPTSFGNAEYAGIGKIR
jgi:hypothetical protein